MSIIDTTKAILKQKQISQWRIIQKISQKNNIYLTKEGAIENITKGQRTDVNLTVYKKQGNSIGDSTVSLISDDPEYISKKIDEAVFTASLVKNPIFNLADEEKIIKKVKLFDKNLRLDEKQLLKITDALKRETAKIKNTKLVQAELLTNINNVKLITSKGINHNIQSTDIFFEATFIAYKGKHEQEHVVMKNFRRLKDIKPQQIAKKYASYAHDVLNSTRTKHFSGPVLLSNDAIQEFFNPELDVCPLITHASARLKYMGVARYQLNKPIIEKMTGDKITIINNPLIDYNIASQQFDEDGIPAKKTILIKDNIFKSHFANKRYADYLNIKPTGPLGVIEVKPGSKSIKQLYKSSKERPILEIVAFSSYSPEGLSGNFTVEIRLGYLYKGKQRIPIKGGMFTGNIFELIKHMHLSKEIAEFSGYKGPRVIRFEQAVVSGI